MYGALLFLFFGVVHRGSVLPFYADLQHLKQNLNLYLEPVSPVHLLIIKLHTGLEAVA